MAMQMWLMVLFSPPQLININESYMSLLGDNGEVREDLRVPENDIGKEIESKFEAGEDFLVSVTSRSEGHKTLHESA